MFRTFSSLVDAESAQAAVNTYLSRAVEGYCAERWSLVIKHRSQNLWVFYVDEKVRGAFSDEEWVQNAPDLAGW